MTREEQAIADIRRIKAEYMNGQQMDEVNSRKCESLDMAIQALSQKWIPVSERLPETNDEMLVT